MYFYIITSIKTKPKLNQACDIHVDQGMEVCIICF